MNKKIIVALITGMVITTTFSFKQLYETKQGTAEVEQIQGVYVFTDSKPVSQYDYLGTEKVSLSLSGSYQELRDKLIKKVRKEYPSANGIIIHLGEGKDNADAIKLK